MAVFVVVFGVVMLLFCGNCCCAAGNTALRRRRNQAWVKQGQQQPAAASRRAGTERGLVPGGLAEGLLLPAPRPDGPSGGLPEAQRWPEMCGGIWRGHYHQYGGQHSLFEFSMRFEGGTASDPTPRVAGSGRDTIGDYTITEGAFNRATGRLCFTKKYKRGTGDPFENLGHCVEYSGTIQGCIAAGVRGRWYVSTSRYTGEGSFHLWPASTTTAAPQAHAQQGLSRTSSMAEPIGDTFAAAAENECVVCFVSHTPLALAAFFEAAGHETVTARSWRLPWARVES